MRLIISVSDNVVIIDGNARKVNCESIAELHAVQWYGDEGEGEIEYFMHGKPNETIKDVSRFQHLIDAYEVAKKEER